MTRTNDGRRGAPAGLWWALNAAAGALFLVGLLSPLTPSEGRPTALDVGVFVGLPLALLLGSIALTGRRAQRVVSGSVALAVVAMTAWLYGVHTGAW